MDKFPEAFKRFEKVIETKNMRSFSQLKLSFENWAGEKWIDTRRQNEALKREARKIGIPVHGTIYSWKYHRPAVAWQKNVVVEAETFLWRREKIKIRGRLQVKCRDKKTGRFIKEPM